MSLAPGFRLGSYDIVAPLGAGGKGEVYRARDTRLGRDVAIKVLPSAVASDVSRLERFSREARSASALNHPNILTVHELGTHQRQPYIVTRDGRLKILDFGLAKVRETSDHEVTKQELTDRGVVLGTAGYMAPWPAHLRTRATQ